MDAQHVAADGQGDLVEWRLSEALPVHRQQPAATVLVAIDADLRTGGICMQRQCSLGLEVPRIAALIVASQQLLCQGCPLGVSL